MRTRNRLAVYVVALLAVTGVSSLGGAAALDNQQLGARLKAAYPGFITGFDSENLMFKDGTRLPLGAGAEKPFDAWLDHPDIRDMFRYAYPRGAPAVQPGVNFDPGRARNEAFFSKIYGDCRSPGFAQSLTSIRWLPKKANQKIIVSRENGVAEHLQAVSNELDALPSRFDAYLIPSAGGYLCRTIAGTDRKSGHAYGIAIDIATKHSHYWRWVRQGQNGSIVYRNAIPPEIVDIFEKHGFIWGGRWYHYDTMHFEYRPELLGLQK